MIAYSKIFGSLVDRDSRFGSWFLSIARNLGSAIRCVMISRLGVTHH